MKIKVCGMRDEKNIQSLVALNPDFMGFIFYAKSKRFVSDFPIITIPSHIKKVGVFVNESIAYVLDKVNRYKLDYVQLHGSESPEYCALLEDVKIMKAFSVDDDFDFEKTTAYQSTCDYMLFDTKGKDYGGNGVKFNWNVLKSYTGSTPFLLSGGISKNDVNEINAIEHPALEGVDINSGFEMEPALKNINDIKEFKQNLR